jgi:hypothetical protein
MVLNESDVTIHEWVSRSGETISAAQDQASLYRRADAARWAITELGVDPRVALSHAVWPTAVVRSFGS